MVTTITTYLVNNFLIFMQNFREQLLTYNSAQMTPILIHSTLKTKPMTFSNLSDHMETLRIEVFNIVNSPYCVEADDGQKVYDLIKAALVEGRQVELSFLNVEILTTAFLNTAVGQLYRDFTEEQVKEALSVADITASGRVALRRVVETAKLYYKDPEAMERRAREILGE